MSKKGISLLFTVVFLLFLITPTILIIVDDTTDISLVFSDSEEEEMESKDKLDIEILIPFDKINSQTFFVVSTKNKPVYFYKKYTKPHLNIISPPPDYILL